MGKRAANGMGSIVKRSDGRYHAAVYVHTPTGERIRKYVYGKTWQEVNDKRIQLLDNNRKGIPSATSSMKLDVYCDYWLYEVAQHELRTKTFTDYESLVDHYIRPHLGKKRLNALGVGEVRTFLRTVSTQPGRKGTKLSPRTVRYIHAVLRSALQHAVREELLGRNVAKLVSPPASEDHEITPMAPHQARTLVEQAQQHWLCALWLIYLATGLRRGEALGLAWSDVNLTTGELRIRRTVQRVNGDLIFGEPKTARSRRTLHLPDICVQALKQHRQLVEERALPAQRNPHPQQPRDLIFVTRTDRVIDPRSINRAFTTLLQRAGLQHVRVHDLRHTCATFLKMQGASDREVMEQLGHSSIGITMNIYAHVLDDSKREMSNRMNRFLNTD